MWARLCVYTCIHMYMYEPQGKHVTKTYKLHMLCVVWVLIITWCMHCHLGWRTLVLKCNKNNYDWLMYVECAHLHMHVQLVCFSHMAATIVFWYSTVCDLAVLSPCVFLSRYLYYNQISALPSNVFENCTSLVTLWVEMCCWAAVWSSSSCSVVQRMQQHNQA